MNITAIIAAVSAAVSFGVGWQLQGIRIDHLKAEYANERLAIEQSSRKQLADAAEKVASAQVAAKVATDRLKRDAAGAVVADNGLRDTLASAVRAAHTDLQTCTRQVDAIGELLTASTDLSRRLATEADEWSVQAVTLQDAWPK